MWIAFLSVLLDPLVLGVAVIGVLFVRRPLHLRLIVAGVAAALSLSELIGGLHEPLTAVLANAAGAAAGGLLIAEAARFIVAPIAAFVISLTIYAVASLNNRKNK